MKRIQWISLFLIVLIIIACIMPWVRIPVADLTITGVNTEGTRFGKPAYLHFLLAGLIVIFTFIQRLWAKRFNLLFASLNLAWAIKNFLLVSRCEAGVCPEKQAGIYLLLITSVGLLITTFFPDIEIKSDNSNLDEKDNIET